MKPLASIHPLPTHVINEQELIGRLQRRDEAAFKELVQLHKNRVYNTCLGFLKNEVDAQDLSQEVFIQVYDSIEEFRGEAALSTWIYRIAVSKSLELIRFRKREKRSGFFQALQNVFNETEEVEDTDGFIHPGVQLENKERARILFLAIDKLPERQRVAFTLQKVEHLSYQEVSEVMELSQAAVEALLHRAKANLRTQLVSYYEQNEID